MKRERREILKMVEDQVISAEQGEQLLAAMRLGDEPVTSTAQPPTAGPEKKRFVHISVSSGAGERVEVNLPVKLGKFALKLIPENAREAVEEQGIDLEDLAACLSEELPNGPLLQCSTADGSRIEITIDAG